MSINTSDLYNSFRQGWENLRAGKPEHLQAMDWARCYQRLHAHELRLLLGEFQGMQAFTDLSKRDLALMLYQAIRSDEASVEPDSDETTSSKADKGPNKEKSGGGSGTEEEKGSAGEAETEQAEQVAAESQHGATRASARASARASRRGAGQEHRPLNGPRVLQRSAAASVPPDSAQSNEDLAGKEVGHKRRRRGRRERLPLRRRTGHLGRGGGSSTSASSCGSGSAVSTESDSDSGEEMAKFTEAVERAVAKALRKQDGKRGSKSSTREARRKPPAGSVRPGSRAGEGEQVSTWMRRRHAAPALPPTPSAPLLLPSAGLDRLLRTLLRMVSTRVVPGKDPAKCRVQANKVVEDWISGQSEVRQGMVAKLRDFESMERRMKEEPWYSRECATEASVVVSGRLMGRILQRLDFRAAGSKVRWAVKKSVAWSVEGTSGAHVALVCACMGDKRLGAGYRLFPSTAGDLERSHIDPAWVAAAPAFTATHLLDLICEALDLLKEIPLDAAALMQQASALVLVYAVGSASAGMGEGRAGELAAELVLRRVLFDNRLTLVSEEDISRIKLMMVNALKFQDWKREHGGTPVVQGAPGHRYGHGQSHESQSKKERESVAVAASSAAVPVE